MQFRFGDHCLDSDRRELRRRGALVALEPQVFDLLVYLVQNRDRVVSKDDLLEAVCGRPDCVGVGAVQPDNRGA